MAKKKREKTRYEHHMEFLEEMKKGLQKLPSNTSGSHLVDLEIKERLGGWKPGDAAPRNLSEKELLRLLMRFRK